MSIRLRLWLFCALAIFPGAGLAAPVQVQVAADPTYAALRGAKLDGRKIPVQNLVLERDAFHFQFDSGAFHLLAPVDGHTVGADFVGQGKPGSSRSPPGSTRVSRC